METYPIAYNSTEIDDRNHWLKLPHRFHSLSVPESDQMTIIFCKDCQFISGERANNHVHVMKK